MSSPSSASETVSLTRYAWISIWAAVVTIVLKAAAYYITGSVGLLSDALESIVNLAGGVMALAMLSVAARPEDDEHAFGHGKAEYFSSGVEGCLILVASVSIAWTSIPRLFHPQALEELGVGLIVSLAASLINLAVALWLLRAAKLHRSITLEANAKHLMTDVWTSVAVVGAIGLVSITHWQWLDPVVALIVAVNILWTGFGIVRRSVDGLMDRSLEPEDRAALDKVLAGYRKREQIDFHAVMTRQAGAQRFVSLHVLVPGEWSIQRGHELLERIEGDIRGALPKCTVFTHIEPNEDPVSFEDQHLNRK